MEAIDIRELRSIKPLYLTVCREMRNHRLECVARAPAMRYPQESFRIELMALSPAAPGSLDDGARVDEDAIEVKQERCSTELHSP